MTTTQVTWPDWAPARGGWVRQVYVGGGDPTARSEVWHVAENLFVGSEWACLRTVCHHGDIRIDRRSLDRRADAERSESPDRRCKICVTKLERSGWVTDRTVFDNGGRSPWGDPAPRPVVPVAAPRSSPKVVILDHVERVHPKQDISTGWRWGPRWEDGEDGGVWVISRVNITRPPMAIRLAHDEDARLIEWRHFANRLEDLRDGCLDLDDELRALDDTPAPERPAVPAVLADDLAALNNLARESLG